MYIKLFLGEKTAPGVFSFDYSKEFIRSCGKDEFEEKLKFADLSFVDSPEVFVKAVSDAVDEAMDNEFNASEVYKAGKCPDTGKVCYICVNIEDYEEKTA
ncbi:MAG: hypothetical protein LRY50_05890 [Geovibrio sp.]|jgi:hypothetical protein|uniref:hypothetical protein n=1 Tax=Geovibrio ferrireducens TaxID=46201 RepID=UPI0022451057|nr:hypothetical protein [Geovibrio ferrireducens]MCD8490476.1 hypothetical protein [Geovibrio sp.]MCD8567883.1 hypothetical protein [Geovibrio sp.]